jgi:hypothetical protein
MGTAISLLVFAGLVALAYYGWRKGGRGRTFNVGPGAAGAVYDMLNEDKRKAIEIIVEGRAAYRDPETADDTPKEPITPK